MRGLFLRLSFFSLAFVSSFFGGSLTSDGQTFLFDGSLDFSTDEVGFTGTFTFDPSEPDQDPSALAGLFNLDNVSVTFDDDSIPDFDQGQIANFFVSGSSFQRLNFSVGGIEDLSLLFSSTFTDANLLTPINPDLFDEGSALRDTDGARFGTVDFLNTQAVPEPSCLSLLILMGGGYAFRRRRSGGPE